MANNVFAALAGKTEGDHSAVKSMAEMFGLSENVRITVLPIAKLKEKSNHPFKVIEDERLAALAESIRTEGLIHPVIVRTANDGFYEILSGHRRTRACRMIGETEIKAIIVTADDELANRIMIDTNFQQRESHLPSEIAKSYGIRYNDIKKRQKRHAKNSTGWNSGEDKIDKIMEQEFATSKSKIYMYLRLNYLRIELLDALDSKKLNLKTAVEISYLTDPEQSLIYELVFIQSRYKLDRKKAVSIKKLSAEQKLDEGSVRAVLSDSGTKMNKTMPIFRDTEIARYRNKFKSAEEMRTVIIRFLENY